MTAVAEVQPYPRVREFLSGTKKLLIDGEWVDAGSGRTFATYDPATGGKLADVAHGEAADIDVAVRAARAAFDGPWSRLKSNQRERLIWRHGDAGFFVEPTVFVDVRPSLSIVREEIFGPVVAAIPFSSEDDLVAAANDSEYGLAAGIWTRDLSKAHRVAKRLKAGSVWVDQYDGFDTALPFGGYKQSGWGRELGAAAIDLYTQTKAVNIAL